MVSVPCDPMTQALNVPFMLLFGESLTWIHWGQKELFVHAMYSLLDFTLIPISN